MELQKLIHLSCLNILISLLILSCRLFIAFLSGGSRVRKNFRLILLFSLIKRMMCFGSLRNLLSAIGMCFVDVDASIESVMSLVRLDIVLSMSFSVKVGSKL